MINRNTKHWLFTWETNVSQKHLPNRNKLNLFLNSTCDFASFQLECGEIKGKNHYQGGFTLTGVRQSKIGLLKVFEDHFKNTSGLTLQKAHDKEAVMRYVTKDVTRLEGPFYCGKKEKFDLKMSMISLRDWQLDLFDYLKSKLNNKDFRGRKIIWLEDLTGNTGKSTFLKWLRVGQKDFAARKLPVSSVERLISAVTKVTIDTKIDLFMINLPRTQGKEQSFKDLFSAIEEVVDGYCVDVMYGKYVEAIFDPPLVVIFTNERISDYLNYLSKDRWVRLIIDSDKCLQEWPLDTSNGITPCYINESRNPLKTNETIKK